ncbi:hypothetical protein IE077_003710 [Cardiosporidium cionae]|uniref:SMODS and SLOG-associating 2TM effector domain-containing protein n=1 Tax=Cardiosporidium cionae TaxID=476202 RepID=A0ABQ7J7M7_9APIC|nr:hypothetical protein IE077_003710 [Cardiosporidium cionae]|eukprot:KAF8819999.1 hypothetical protein IE077_003710 [Cardiosporidium cionae]
MLTYPFEEANFPAKQLEDLRRLELIIKDSVSNIAKGEAKYRGFFVVLVLICALCLWHDYRLFDSETMKDVIQISLAFGSFLVSLCALTTFLSIKECVECLHETRIYLRRMNKWLHTMNLHFDRRTSSLNIFAEKDK